jgi:hypothetical protein
MRNAERLEEIVKAINAVSALPRSFKEALKLGWEVVKEETTSSADERQRTGVLLLGQKGAPVRLRLTYTATVKAWKFGTLEAIEESIAA